MQADLVHINRATQLTEPALAKSWKISPDGLRYTLVLRRGLKFSDGYPMDADDVLFTFRLYLDEKVHAPQRDLLIFDGQPISLQKVDSHTIVFQLPKPYGVMERMFDGWAILPRHLLEKPYEAGKTAQVGALTAPPEMIQKQKWFRDLKFRQAVSSAVDREAIVRLVYQGRGAALWGLVTPGNRRWADEKLPHPPRSLEKARELLKEAGFSWGVPGNGDSWLQDSNGKPVEFSIIAQSSSSERSKMAALIQDDLKQLGMRVQVVQLESRSLLNRVTQTKPYDACVLGAASYDEDPNSDINVWLSSGGLHLWNPSQAHPATPWEAEIDRLINEQMYASTFEQRKTL